MREGWEIKRLGDLTTAINGLWVGKKPPFVNIAVIRNTNFTKDCRLDTTDIAFIDAEVKHFSTRKLQFGDIIIEKSGGSDKQPVGRPVIFNIPNGDYSFSNFTSTLRINNKEEITPAFLHKVLFAIYRSGKTASMQSKTTGIRNLDFKSYLKLPIPVPPVQEQKKIVAELDCLSGIIEKKKQQLKELDNLAQSIFYDMFGNPITNEKGWDVEQLGSLSTIVRGGSPRPIEKFLGGTIPWIKIGDATDDNSMFINATKEHIIEEGLKKTRYIPAGSLIFANCGVSLGFARIITFDGCIHDGWLAIQDISEKIDPIFLLRTINFCTKYFRDIAPGGTQPNLNTGIMKSFKQIVPPRSTQTLFVQKIKAIEIQKELIKKSIQETETLFNSRMDYWFN